MQTIWNWFSLLDLLQRPYVFCLLLPYHVAVHTNIGRLGWEKLHLCSSRDHQNIRIDWICVHRQGVLVPMRGAKRCIKEETILSKQHEQGIRSCCIRCGLGGVEVRWTVYVVWFSVDDVTPDRRSPCHIGTGAACFLLQPLCEVTLYAMTE